MAADLPPQTLARLLGLLVLFSFTSLNMPQTPCNRDYKAVNTSTLGPVCHRPVAVLLGIESWDFADFHIRWVQSLSVHGSRV